MSEYDNTNRGVLFKNDKGDNPKRPDYRGNADIDGVKYKISAWINEARNTGKKYMSLSFELEEATEEDRGGWEPTQRVDPPTQTEIDDIPF